MKTSAKQVAALSAIILINIHFVVYFYKRSQRTMPVLSNTHDKMLPIRIPASSDTNRTRQFVFTNSTNPHTNPTGFISAYEYRSLLQTIPREEKVMQTFLGLVLDQANQTEECINAFRELLKMANSASAQSKYAEYRLVLPNHTETAPPIAAKSPASKTNFKYTEKSTLVEKPVSQKMHSKQPVTEEIPHYDVERLSFEPIGQSHGASFFNMYHATEPKYFSHLTPTIPHIIHQTWDSYSIPGIFKPWIKSMVDKHPDWEYWFWTPKDVECLLRIRFTSEHLDTYKKYHSMIFKSDFLRYFLLYEFGGFYVDLDVQALQPLDFWTYRHQCVISHENYEHTYLLHNRKQPNVMTTIIGSRPKHPYFKLLQDNLATYQRRFSRDVLRATGPFYLDDIFNKFLHSNISKDVENSITVIHPRYWLPKYDYRLTSRLRKICATAKSRLTEHGREVCHLLARSNFQSKLSTDSFLDHHWTHVNTWRGTQKTRGLFNLFDVVPNAIRASDKLNCRLT